jgi:hypothetical protein
MNRSPSDGDETVRSALATLADLDRLRSVDQPLLASAANRAHAALARALASIAPDAFDAVT